MKQQNNIQSIGDTLKLLIESLGIENKIEQYKIFDVWNSAVGEQIAKVAKPERLEKNVLVVNVSNSPWRSELTFRKKEILEKIHTVTNSKSIIDIKFR